MAENINKDVRDLLRQQSEETCVAFAVRAALRVWPDYLAYINHRDAMDGSSRASSYALNAFRTMLDGYLAAVVPVPGTSFAHHAEIAAKICDAATESHGTEPSVHLGIAQKTGLTADFAATAFSSLRWLTKQQGWVAAENAAISVCLEDAAEPPENMLSAPLWRVDGLPDGIGGPEVVEAELTNLGDAFDVWAHWYRDVFEGKRIDLELQRRIALIEDEVWIGNNAPKRIAERIARIEAEYLVERAALAEDVEINPETGKVRVVPRPLENAQLIGTILARTEDALQDALQGRNGLREDMRQVRMLRRTHARYGNDPQRIEMDYTSVAVSLRREIHETGELADTEDNLGLLEAVEEGALAVRAHHPEVADYRTRIAAQRLREADPESLALLEIAEPILVEMSEDVAAEDFARDIPQLINDATIPLPSGAPPLPGADEATRIFNRSAKIKVLWDAGEFSENSVERWQELAGNAAEAFDSKGFKAVRFVWTVGDILLALVRLGLKLFGVL